MRIETREDGIKEIFLEEEHEVEHLLGKFITKDDYDLIIDFSCDVYKPNKKIGVDPRDESLVLMKFRKGVFSEDLLKNAYDGLEKGAGATQNRGLAAGPRTGKLGGREWLTNMQLEIIECFQNGTVSLVDEDPIEEIRSKWAGKDGPTSRGWVWLTNKTEAENFQFDEWVEKTRALPTPEKRAEANRVAKELVSETTYANSVNSGIAGFFDRYPRIPYCRETAYSANNKEMFNEKAIPFINAIAEQFKQLMPYRFSQQKAYCNKVDPEFIIGDSVYTTITINKNFQTACHYDAGDLKEGFGNIVALSNGKDYDGGYTVFPAYRVGVDLRPGDMLCFDPGHILHGNTEITSEAGDHERVSVVLYFREKMLECESKIIEDLRYKYVEHRRKNPDHPLQRPLWNGISPGMWDEEEWVDYLLAHGMNDYVAENFSNKAGERISLDEFF